MWITVTIIQYKYKVAYTRSTIRREWVNTGIGISADKNNWQLLKSENTTLQWIPDIYSHLYEFVGTTIRKSQTGCFKQQKFIFSQFWRLEVQDHCIGRFDFFWGLSPWFTDFHLLALSSQGFSPVPTHPCLLALLRVPVILD